MYLIHTQRSALNQWFAHVTMEERVMERGTLSKKTAIHANVNLASGYVQNVFVLAYVQPGVTLITRLLMDGSMISMETVIMFL